MSPILCTGNEQKHVSAGKSSDVLVNQLRPINVYASSWCWINFGFTSRISLYNLTICKCNRINLSITNLGKPQIKVHIRFNGAFRGLLMRLRAWFARASASELNSLKMINVSFTSQKEESKNPIKQRGFQELFEHKHHKSMIPKFNTSVIYSI